MLKGYGGINEGMGRNFEDFADDIADAVRGFFGGRSPAQRNLPTDTNPEPERTPEAQALYDVIEDRLNEVRAAATANHARPTLEQYREACEAFAQTDEGKAMVAAKQWGPKIYANLSEHDLTWNGTDSAGKPLSGFSISEPSKQQLSKRATSNLMDLDGDGAIGDFYTNIDFNGANLKDAWVDPATSYNDEIAKAGNLKGLTFHGMEDGDTFRFRAGGNYEVVKITGVNGGKIKFNDHSHVDGLTIEGKAAQISIGDYSTVNDLNVSDEFRILKLKMGRNSVLSNSDLKDSTISMSSHFEPGATFQNVALHGNLSGLDLSGVILNNVTIDGMPIQRSSDLDRFGISYDETTRASVSPEMAAQYQKSQLLLQVAELGKTAFGFDTGTLTPTPARVPETSAAQKETDTLDGLARAQVIKQANAERNGNDPLADLVAAMVAAGVSHGAEATASGAGTAVAVLKRTVPENEQATVANMSRSASGNA